jgi:hypothetical protein
MKNNQEITMSEFPSGIVQLAERRTRPFIRFWAFRKSSLQDLVSAAYLQGVNDALETKEKENGVAG